MTLTQLQTENNQFINIQPIFLSKEANSLTQSLVDCQAKTESINNTPLSNIPLKTLKQLKQSKKNIHILHDQAHIAKLSNEVLQHLFDLTKKLYTSELNLEYQYFRQKFNLNLSHTKLVLNYLQSKGLIRRSVQFWESNKSYANQSRRASWKMLITVIRHKQKKAVRVARTQLIGNQTK